MKNDHHDINSASDDDDLNQEEITYRSYLKIARDANKYARRKAQTSATNSFLTKTLFKEINEKVVNMRQKVADNLSFRDLLHDYFDISNSYIKYVKKMKKIVKNDFIMPISFKYSLTS